MGVIRHFNPKEFSVPGVPSFGKITYGQFAFQHFPLQPKANDDVEVVRRLIGFHSDESRRDHIGRAIQGARVKSPRPIPQNVMGQGGCPFPEGGTASNLVFPHPALRFMDSE